MVLQDYKTGLTEDVGCKAKAEQLSLAGIFFNECEVRFSLFWGRKFCAVPGQKFLQDH